MSGIITLERAQLHLEAWLDAELKVSTGQSYTIGSRSLTRANITEIKKQITFWRNEITKIENRMNGRSRRTSRFIPRDL